MVRVFQLRNFVITAVAIVWTGQVWAGIYSGPQETANPIDGAIPSNSPRLVEWANNISSLASGLTYFAPRGSTTISLTGYNCLGDLNATQFANGDSPGFLTVTFPQGITNGLGADFAIFENGFTFGSPNGLFVDLAYVEISTNGLAFARFPNLSLNTAPVQGSGAFAGYDMSNVWNLAGKHAQGFGTPFNLDDLLTDALVLSGEVNLNNIQYVKLVDIPGNGAFKDSLGNGILDNWLTSGTGGFDFRLPVGLGVGVVNVVPEANSVILLGSALGITVLRGRPTRKRNRRARFLTAGGNSLLSHREDAAVIYISAS
jgi:hypothetical protein